MRHKNKRYINLTLYAIFVITYLFVIRTYGMGNENSIIRYYILLAIVLIGIITLIVINRKNIKFNEKLAVHFKEKGLLLSIPIAMLFLMISLFKSNIVNFNIRTIVQISLFLLPTLYAFIAINIFQKKEIVLIFQFTVVALIITYFTENTHTLIDFFNIENWKQIDFLKSNSFTESHICARSFTILFLFFYYIYRTGRRKIDFSFMIITFIFTILCFKRLDVIVVSMVMVFGRFLNLEKGIKTKTIVIVTITISILTILYVNVLQGNLLNNLDIYQITSGRSRILELWKKRNYLSYGYGTSMLVIRRYLELDLVEMYMELNIFALAAFVYVYMNTAKKSIYAYLIISYAILNMLTASSLANTLAWVIQMVTIAYISNDTIERIEEKNNDNNQNSEKDKLLV